MIDHVDALTTIRSRLLGATVATTGSATLSATSTGYARSAGSFLDDDFSVGDEITEATGFSSSANNQATTAQGRVITAVTATAIACSGCSAESASTGRTITVGVPFKRAWSNTKFTPVAGFPYIADRFVPATHNTVTFPPTNAQAHETGLYVVTWFGLSEKGESAIRRGVQAILERFTPGTSLTLDSGDVLRVRGANPGDPGPQAGQIIPIEGGWSYCQITIPWWSQSVNLIAA